MTDAEGAQLSEIPIFGGLPDEDIAALRKLAQPSERATGEWLFRQGEQADCFYAVLSGGLDILVRTPNGDERLIVHTGPGTIVGETSVLIGGERSASAQATEPTVLLAFPDEGLRAMLRAESLTAYRIVYRLAQALAHRLRELDAHVAQMSGSDGSAVTEDDLDRLRRIFFTDWGAAAHRGSV
jgi:CRP/FNR family cyclic AMP-dependent transcriptional regulator